MMTRTLWILLLSVSSAVAYSAQQPRFDALVREDFFAGFDGDAARFQRAMAVTEQMLAKEPGNAEIMSWHGTGTFFSSTAAFQKGDIQSGLKLMNAGVAEMAEAVRLAPDNVAVRIPRGAALISATRHMPAQQVQKLLETGVEDFEATLRLQQAKIDQLSVHSKGELLIGLADGWNRLGNGTKARQYFERIASDSQLKGSVYGEKASAWLAGSPETKAPAFFNCTGCHRRVDLTVPAGEQ
jgi:hypothetical protein